jgi:hypothetical protein
MNYTVIVEVRQQFGDQDLDIGVFAGQQKSFAFDCPNVDRGQTAVLVFQGQRVGREQTLQVNGVDVSGGIPPGPLAAGFTEPAGSTASTAHRHAFSGPSFGWSAYVMLVRPNVLREAGNVLRVASQESTEFVIDNVAVFFKTRFPGPVIALPVAPE